MAATLEGGAAASPGWAAVDVPDADGVVLASLSANGPVLATN
jgi:hypothetical protein